MVHRTPRLARPRFCRHRNGIAAPVKRVSIHCRAGRAALSPADHPPRAPGAIMSAIPVPVITIGLLVISNVFMTFAWYGHLNHKSAPLWAVIFISWGIAFFEYVLMVPANRIGHGHFSAAELKTIQEVITLTVFAGFSVFFLKEPLTWNHFVGFGFIICGAFFIFHKWA
jgi:uncharacterized protein (DUF486 family)